MQIQSALGPERYAYFSVSASGANEIVAAVAGFQPILLGYRVWSSVATTRAAAGITTVTFKDSTGAADATSPVEGTYVPNAAGTTGQLFDTGWIDIPEGLPIANGPANSNNLSATLSATLNNGSFRGHVKYRMRKLS